MVEGKEKALVSEKTEIVFGQPIPLSEIARSSCRRSGQPYARCEPRRAAHPGQPTEALVAM